MDRTQADLARDEIIDLVEGTAFAEPERPQRTKEGLGRTIADRGLLATAEAVCDRIWYWRLVADNLDNMARKHASAGAGSENVRQLQERAGELRGNAACLERAISDIAI